MRERWHPFLAVTQVTRKVSGLRMDGKPALDLGDLIVTVLHGNTHQHDPVRGDQYKSQTRKKIHGKIDDLNNVDLVSSNVNSSCKEALLYISEDNEAVIKMIIKGRSPTMSHVSRTHRVALDWLFDRIKLDLKIQIKYIDTKNQLADIVTEGNFTRDEWNHLLCFFNISHFSSINSLEAMSKRTPEDAGEERVTAKSKPMMNLVSRYRVRDPNVLASTASEKPGENQIWKSERTSELVKCAANKYGETRIWQVCHWWWYGLWHRHRIEPFSKITIILEQSEWLIAKDAGPFSRRCNARHRQTLYELVNVYVFDTGSICIHGKELLRQFTFLKNTGKHLTLKQMFEFSEKLIVGQSDEIFGVFQISWESSPWKQLSLVDDEEVISLSHAKVYVFSDSVLYLGNLNQIQRFITIQNFGQLTENRWNSSGIFSQDSLHCSSSKKSKSSWTKWANQNNSKDELSSCRCSMTSYGEVKTKKRNVLLRPQGEWDRVAEMMMIKFRESGHPVFRATSPLSRGTLKSKGGGKLSIHLCADGKRLKLFFAQLFLSITSVSTEQSQLCVTNTVLVKQVRWDPYWQSNLTQLFAPAKLLIMTPTPSIEIPA